MGNTLAEWMPRRQCPVRPSSRFFGNEHDWSEWQMGSNYNENYHTMLRPFRTAFTFTLMRRRTCLFCGMMETQRLAADGKWTYYFNFVVSANDFMPTLPHIDIIKAVYDLKQIAMMGTYVLTT